MYYQMHVLAHHPLLMSYPSQDAEPRQQADMTVSAYIQRWLHFIHIQLLHGIFVSNRYYYLLQLVANLYPSFRDSLGRLLSADALEKVSDINRALPNSFAPDQIHIKLVELVRHAGKPQLIIKTPRELYHPTGEIRELSTSTTDTGFRQMIAALSSPTPAAAATGFGPRRCFFCNKEECTLLTCPTALAAKSDPFIHKTIVKYFGIRALDFDTGVDTLESTIVDPPDPMDHITEDLLNLDLTSGGGEDHPPDSDFR
jgi:hypothetical protein